jgi:hypothetical protein
MYCVFFDAMNQWLRIGLMLCLALGGCATPEILEPKNAAVPPGLDLSGNWVMREIPPAERRRISEAIRKTDGVDDREVYGRPQQSRSRSRGGSRSFKGGLVYVFLETGTALKVTQTPHGLFISFDRSVVEEFRFGEVRIVSVGEIEAQRVTGWEGNQLVVETLDKNGMKLTERFQLLDGGNTLQRQITFRSKKLEEETIVQEFDRAD